MVLISVVIVTKDRYEHLKNCLSSLNNQTFKDFEVIVVSRELTGRMRKLQIEYGGKFIEQDGVGRCNARNLGISMSNGEIIAFIDDDAIASECWLENIVATFKRDTKIGGVSGKVYSLPLKETRKMSRTALETIYTKLIWEHLRDRFTGDLESGGNVREVKAFIGCNMAFRKEILKEVGGFDENFYGISTAEEYDVCFRVRKLGYKLIFNPEIKVRHFGELRLRTPGDFYHFMNNHVYHVVKNEVLESPFDWLLDFLRLFTLAMTYIRDPTDRFLASKNVLTAAITGYKRGKIARERLIYP